MRVKLPLLIFGISLQASAAFALAAPQSPLSLAGPEVELFGQKISSTYFLDEKSQVQKMQISIAQSLIEAAGAQSQAGVKLAVPEQVKDSFLFQHVTIAWNPEGIEPLYNYGKPLFDFHFYTIDEPAVTRIDCTDQQLVPASLIAEDFMLIPTDSPLYCRPGMGIPSFSKWDMDPDHVFDETIFFSYYAGKLIAFESKLSYELLAGKSEVERSIPFPSYFLFEVKKGVFVPHSYTLRFDEENAVYRLELSR